MTDKQMTSLGENPLQPRSRDLADLRWAAGLLDALRSDPDNLQLLLTLQRHLLARICGRERHIARLRLLAARQRASLRKERRDKAQSKALRRRIELVEVKVRSSKRWLFVWKSFGDGAACVYQSPYNLKHLFYDHNYEVKEDAGTITGKLGFAKELAHLEWAIREGVPAVLSDLTNMIRTGDLCLLAAADPVPMEIKTSRTSGARNARQHRNLQEVLAFYENDGAENYRGLSKVTRQAVSWGPSHEAVMNGCIADARVNGLASATAETGLHYVAWQSRADGVGLLDALIAPGTLAWLLTPDPGWLPCYPFTLSLTPDNLLSFVTGEITMCVLIDTKHLKSLFRQRGTHAIMLMDGTFAMQLCRDASDLMMGVDRVTELLFARIALEFQSLAWFAEQYAYKPDEATSPAPAPAQVAAGNYLREAPVDWMQAVDCYDGTPGAISAGRGSED